MTQPTPPNQPSRPEDFLPDSPTFKTEVEKRIESDAEIASKVAQRHVVESVVNEQRIIKEARMLPEGPLSYEVIQASREHVKAYIDRNELKISDVAKQIARSPSSVTQFLNNNYSGDCGLLARLLVGWIEMHAQGKNTGMPQGFVSTRVTTEILAVLRETQRTCTVGLVLGSAGAGKSMVAQACEAGLIVGSVYYEVTQTESTPREFVSGWARRLGIDVGKMSTGRVQAAIIDKLHNTRRLQMIDEAGYLSPKALNIVRDVHKQARVGVALIGTVDIEKAVDDAKFFYGQFARLINLRYDVNESQEEGGRPLYTVDEIVAFAATMGLKLTGEAAERLTELCCIPAWGGLGAATMLLIKARRFAEKEKAAQITLKHLQLADQSSHTRRHLEKLEARRQLTLRKVRVA